LFCIVEFDGPGELSFGAEGVTEFGLDYAFFGIAVLDCVVGCAPETAVEGADVGFVHDMEVFGKLVEIW